MSWDVGEAEGSGGVGGPGSDEVREVDDEGLLVDHSKEPWRFALLYPRKLSVFRLGRGYSDDMEIVSGYSLESGLS